METTFEAKLPEQLLGQAEALVRDGWVSDLNALLVEALRRYIESHQSQLAETFVRDDVQWGLHGRD